MAKQAKHKFNPYKGMYRVFCLDDRKNYYYGASTPYEALTKHIYTLNLSDKDDTATINKTESGLHLYTIHRGKCYAVRN